MGSSPVWGAFGSCRVVDSRKPVHWAPLRLELGASRGERFEGENRWIIASSAYSRLTQAVVEAIISWKPSLATLVFSRSGVEGLEPPAC